jgi:hypothetical protein
VSLGDPFAGSKTVTLLAIQVFSWLLSSLLQIPHSNLEGPAAAPGMVSGDRALVFREQAAARDLFTTLSIIFSLVYRR